MLVFLIDNIYVVKKSYCYNFLDFYGNNFILMLVILFLYLNEGEFI